MTKHAATILVAILLPLLCLAAPRIARAATDGVMMSNGKMMMTEDGKPTLPMDKDITMLNGTKVKTDGTVTQGGAETHMREGQVMMMDGRLTDGGKDVDMKKN